MSGLGSYVLRRLLWIPLILFVASVVTFSLGRYGPGDPATLRAHPGASPETIEQIRHEMGLDRPVWEQYGDYMSGVVLHGDFGESLRYPGVSVRELIVPRMWISAQLGLIALSITFILGMIVGTVAAYSRGKWLDPALISFFLFFQSIPTLISIPFMLWLFVVKLEWLPAAGWEGVFSKNIIIPVLVLSLPGIASVARLMRANVLAVLGEDYVRTARAKGLSEFVVIRRHVVRNALLPMVTIVGLSLVSILEGAFFTELLYGIPGIGRLSLESVFNRDYDVIMALFLIIGSVFIVLQIVVDVAYAFIDPRIRLDKKQE